MKKNIGTTDRWIRVVLAIVLFVMYYQEIFVGTWGVIALVGASVLLLTAVVNFCGLYALFGIKTCKA